MFHPIVRRLLKKPRLGVDRESVDPKANTPTVHSPVILNSDDERLTPNIVDWLMRCIFREADLYQLALSLFSTNLDRCSTISEANDYLVRAVSSFPNQTKTRIDQQTWDRLKCAVQRHIEQVEQNRQAYHPNGFWPDPTTPRNGRSLFTEFPFRVSHKFISASVPISSAGSCFAVEIAHNLQRRGFNYVITEPPAERAATGDNRALADSSADWGIIFNTPSFRQLVERAFGLRKLPKILWTGRPRIDSEEVFMDPFREGVEFRNVAEFEENYEKHIAAARDALAKMRVFIITLGLNEVWTFRMDGSVFSRSPWRIAPSFVEHRVLTVQENVDDLQTMLNMLRRFNPDVKLIVTLSPVPLHATFLHEAAHVVEANLHSKSVLRVAAQQFVEANRDVFYFPSYELITTGLADPWEADQRHVKREAVARVMDMFQEMYVEN